MNPRRKRMTTLLASVTLGLVATSTLTACSGDSSATDGVATLRYQGWSQQVTPAELAENLGFFDGKVKLDWVGNTISGPAEIQATATGQTEFGGAFAGAVAKLASAGAPITAVVNYYGADEKSFVGYYVPDNSPIHSIKDLIGKKVGVNTLGGQNEADIHLALKRAGASLEDIKKVQLVALPPPNTEDALRKGQIDVAALSGQFQQRALATGGLRPVFTEPQEFGTFNGGPYVFRNDYIAKHSGTVRTFATGVAKALEWERVTPREQVIAKFTEIIDGRKRPNENTSTLKYWLSSSVPTPYGKLSAEDFTRWEQWLVDTGAVTGKLDPSKFFTNDYNAEVQK